MDTKTSQELFHPPPPIGDRIMDEWMLDPEIAFMNHGCFGARPKAVVETHQELRHQFEARPVEFLDRRRPQRLLDAKERLAEFLKIRGEDFGFVTNATGGVNAVLRSLSFAPGDEILTLDHVYNAVRMSMRHVAGQIGATAVEAELPLPVTGPEQVLDAIEGALTERTKLFILDHMTSPTALLFPIEPILRMCRDRGIDVLVDGAHAVGMFDLDITELSKLGATYYTGNLHKWLSAPVGSAFLWVHPDRQAEIHPLTISHHYQQGLAAEFAWQGTHDLSAWLSVPAAIDYFETYGWERVRGYNHGLAKWAHQHLTRAWDVEPISPPDGSMLGSMATVRVPESAKARFGSAERLRHCLSREHRIEVPVIEWNDHWWIRVSCQIYLKAEAIERLGEVVMGKGT